MNKIVGAAMAAGLAASGAATAQSPAAKLTDKPAGIIAIEFLDLAFNQKKVDEAVNKYLAAPYTQHNPQVPDGVEGARVALSGFMQAVPGYRYDFKRVLVDGDFVVVHSRVTTGPADRGSALVDIFRVADGKLVEHWDVQQVVPETAANTNTMF